jgi:hypothetical protein
MLTVASSLVRGPEVHERESPGRGEPALPVAAAHRRFDWGIWTAAAEADDDDDMSAAA